MKQKNSAWHNAALCISLSLLFFQGCNAPVASSKQEEMAGYDKDVLNSILLSADSLATFPFIAQRVEKIKASLQNPLPVMLCTDSLTADQQLAQIIALSDKEFTQYTLSADGRSPYRNEIFGIYPARQSDLASLGSYPGIEGLYRVEMYNYALNTASYAVVDIKKQAVLLRSHLPQSQPDIPASLIQLATKIAASSPQVLEALGYKPGEQDALMASTKTALNRSRCERSRHLCVAPTFIKNGKALWAIVDLTEHRLVGIRWTNVGVTGPADAITEKKLQDDKITSCYCEQEQALVQNGWALKYMLTSSDGLRISDVSFNQQPVLRSAKLVDWHVSYSGTDGFGYSDAVGCPSFSQAAVIAWETPRISVLLDAQNKEIGFTLEQTFRSEGWPTPCNYNYRQRYEFYNDGRFRVACASLGRGCGNDGTYRPVFRIALAAEKNNFSSWAGNEWKTWDTEQWELQNSASRYTTEGYLYKLNDEQQKGYYIEPANAQFGDGGRGDNAYVYVTRYDPGKDEGENDLITIGPCCNTDYRQGPEKFIEPNPENIRQSSLVVWYVAQLKNDDRKGHEYCWAESVLQNGVYVTRSYPCFSGPLFVPVK